MIGGRLKRESKAKERKEKVGSWGSGTNKRWKGYQRERNRAFHQTCKRGHRHNKQLKHCERALGHKKDISLDCRSLPILPKSYQYPNDSWQSHKTFYH